MKPSILFALVSVLLNCHVLHAATPAESKYALRPIIRMGQEAPETEGGTFEQIGSVALNNRGEVAFGARISGSRFTSGIFVLSGDSIRKIALNGEPTRYIGPEFSEDFYSVHVAINDLGQVAFASTVGSPGGPQQVGVFYFRADDVFPIAVFPPVASGTPDYVTGVSLNNKWEIAFSKNSGVYLFSKDHIVPIVTIGEQTDGTGTFRSFSDATINNSGQIAFYGDATESGSGGLFLYSGGKISSIMHQGQPGPGVPGATFDSFDFQLDDAGDVLFAGVQVNVTPMGGHIYNRFGLYLYSGGVVSVVFVPGQQLPGQDAVLGSVHAFALSQSGRIAVSGPSSYDFRPYLLSPDGFSAVHGFLDGNPPDNAAGPYFYSLALNNSGTLVLGGFISEPGNEVRIELFLAVPINPESIPPDDFDAPGIDGLPMHWSTVWTNGGTGNVSRYDSSGSDAYSGSSTLRLHVGPGGGSIFVLSDPVRILPDRVYAITARMRYALPSDSDFVAFTVLQYDAAGNEIAINELDGVAGDNRWTWKEKAMWVRTLPNAASIRIRFGLMSTVEAYADVDALR